MSQTAGIVLAAGKGTRMKSALPKVLHKVCGVPMVDHAGRAMRGAGVERPIIVYGHGGEQVSSELGDGYLYALQDEQLGTAHAAMQAMPLLEGFGGTVLIAPGDAPLITSDAFKRLIAEFEARDADGVVATCVLEDPRKYGRVIRDSTGEVVKIVEEIDATEEQLAIREVGASIYCFQASVLRSLLPKVSNQNAKNEYYLTDLVGMINDSGGLCCAVLFDDSTLLLGVNDRWQLAEVSKIMRSRILRELALNGVTIDDPDTTFIDADVTIAPDCTIRPMTILEGKTRVGAGTELGPSSRITDSLIGERCLVHMSHVNRVQMGNDCRVGPFANLRPMTVLADRVKIGNFVEIKASDLGEDASVSHLAYIGDATVGARANVGAGTITCNFDGFQKNRTDIGADAFIGSNSTLVAPLKIGDGAFTAAGSTITSDVPDNALAIGRSRQEIKQKWAERWRNKKKKSS